MPTLIFHIRGKPDDVIYKAETDAVPVVGDSMTLYMPEPHDPEHWLPSVLLDRKRWNEKSFRVVGSSRHFFKNELMSAPCKTRETHQVLIALEPIVNTNQ